MRIVPVPCLSDNYAYLVIDTSTREAAVVDPSEAAPVIEAAEREGAEVTAIWLTHHHFDHIGGIDELCARFGDLEVIGSVYDEEHERIPHQTRALTDGERFPFADHEVEILEIPGHTLGAIAYVVNGNLFSGDTLFLGGCGRVFEGTMEMMSSSLSRLRDLPKETRIWCGHEYTVNNLRFALSLEPESETLLEAMREAEAAREEAKPTIPGTLARELETNPFLRFDLPELARGRSAVASFTALRSAKDDF